MALSGGNAAVASYLSANTYSRTPNANRHNFLGGTRQFTHVNRKRLNKEFLMRRRGKGNRDTKEKAK